MLPCVKPCWCSELRCVQFSVLTVELTGSSDVGGLPQAAAVRAATVGQSRHSRQQTARCVVILQYLRHVTVFTMLQANVSKVQRAVYIHV